MSLTVLVFFFSIVQQSVLHCLVLVCFDFELIVYYIIKDSVRFDLKLIVYFVT